VTMPTPPETLPPSLPPRGLSRVAAAAYIGISPSLFDIMVKDGRMPKPKRINARTVWDRKRLDEAFDALPDEEGGNPSDGAKSTNPWDEVAA
jgi:predicted DNA-binding transcriptional regulator AlpA